MKYPLNILVLPATVTEYFLTFCYMSILIKVFDRGISTALETGTIKWVQYITFSLKGTGELHE